MSTERRPKDRYLAYMVGYRTAVSSGVIVEMYQNDCDFLDGWHRGKRDKAAAAHDAAKHYEHDPSKDMLRLQEAGGD